MFQVNSAVRLVVRKQCIYFIVHCRSSLYLPSDRFAMSLPVLASPLIGRAQQLLLLTLAVTQTCQLTQVAAGEQL